MMTRRSILMMCFAGMVSLAGTCFPSQEDTPKSKATPAGIPNEAQEGVERLLKFDVASNSRQLAAARKEFTKLNKSLPSPRLDLAMGIVLLKADKTSEACSFFRKAWKNSEPREISNGQLFLRCLLEEKKYSEALAVAKELSNVIPSGEDDQQALVSIANLIAGVLTVLEAVESDSSSLAKAANKLEAELRSSTNAAFLSAFSAARELSDSQLQTAKAESGAEDADDEIVIKKLDELQSKTEAAEQAATSVKLSKEETIRQLEKRLNAVDATLAEAEKRYEQLSPKVTEGEEYIASLQTALELLTPTNGSVQSGNASTQAIVMVINGRKVSATRSQVQQEGQLAAAKLQALRKELAEVVHVGNQGIAERRSLSEQYHAITGQAAKANSQIANWQARLSKQSDRIKKKAISKQESTVSKQQIAILFPVDIPSIEDQLRKR